MSSASESPAGDLLWQQVRTGYETTTTDLNAIAQALGISRANRGPTCNWSIETTYAISQDDH